MNRVTFIFLVVGIGFAVFEPARGEDLRQICREHGGKWLVTKHGKRGCKCSDGRFLGNVYFDICSNSKRRWIRKDKPPPQEGQGNMTKWGQKGEAWGLSSKKRSLASPLEVTRTFVQNVNSGDINSAMGLVNDYEVHPTRNLDGINLLLRNFPSVRFRDKDLRRYRVYGAVASPRERFSGCLYFEEHRVKLFDGTDEGRMIGTMVIYCTHFSAKNKGKYPIKQARKQCLNYRPKIPRFGCKVGRIDTL